MPLIQLFASSSAPAQKRQTAKIAALGLPPVAGESSEKSVVLSDIPITDRLASSNCATLGVREDVQLNQFGCHTP